MGLGGGGGGLAGAAQIFFDGVDHVLLSGAELFASVDEPPSDGQDAPPGCICSAPRMSDSRDRRLDFYVRHGDTRTYLSATC
jgi:hypothetical protein